MGKCGSEELWVTLVIVVLFALVLKILRTKSNYWEVTRLGSRSVKLRIIKTTISEANDSCKVDYDHHVIYLESFPSSLYSLLVATFSDTRVTTLTDLLIGGHHQFVRSSYLLVTAISLFENCCDVCDIILLCVWIWQHPVALLLLQTLTGLQLVLLLD